MSATRTKKRLVPKALKEERLPFMEQMKKNYRDHPPNFVMKKESLNKFGVVYFLVMLFGQYSIGTWYIVPYMYDGEYTWIWQLVLTLVFIESFYNWFQCCRKYVNKAEKVTEHADKNESSSWRYCALCQHYVPPRAHHCRLCKVCILRHDHHCYFAGGCIGLYTASYFVSLCFWGLMSQIFAVYWQTMYMMQEFPDKLSVLPIVSLYYCGTGQQPWLNLLLLINFYCFIPNIFVVTFYLVVELIAASGNQTFYEGSRGIRYYHTGSIFSNFVATYGNYMWIRWLIPFYSSPPSDGYSWPVNKFK